MKLARGIRMFFMSMLNLSGHAHNQMKMQKIMLVGIGFLGLLFSVPSFADCMMDKQNVNQGCGLGRCAMDRKGNVACSQVDGGDCLVDGSGNVACSTKPHTRCERKWAGNVICDLDGGFPGNNGGYCMVDGRKRVGCGKGFCAKDRLDNVACSPVVRGDCLKDARGNVGCSTKPHTRCMHDQGGNVICDLNFDL